MRFSVVGLGKLGASMAAAIADRGHEVVGVDVDPRAVDAVNAGRAPVDETGLTERIEANRERLRATLDHGEAVRESELTFVVVPTPSDDRGAFSLQYAAEAFREIGRGLRTKDGYHNVVLTSTVLPGSTRYGLRPILERESGRRCGAELGLCYSPEFIALGSVIRDFLNPDFTLVGEWDERAGEQLEAAYARIVENGAPCRRMSIENAELTKVALNTYVTMKVTYANMLAEICERLPGGDVDAVTDALGLDERIGRKYLTGALGYGGPCFPRDNVAFAFMADAVGAGAPLAETTDRANRESSDSLAGRVVSMIPEDATVAVLGLAYKPDTPVIDESPGVALARALVRAGVRVVAYDPLAGENARVELGDSVVVLDALDACLERADAVVVTTPDAAFRTLTRSDLERRGGEVLVVDFWRILPAEVACSPQVRYVPIGRSVDDAANGERLAALWDGAGAE
ncbi:MAG: UDP-glucose dehydrogenase family protein [Gemmatimonadota bacterium]